YWCCIGSAFEGRGSTTSANRTDRALHAESEIQVPRVQPVNFEDGSMKRIKKTPIASAIALVLMSAAFQAKADPADGAQEPATAADQAAAAAKPKDEPKDSTKLETVVVTGIGASLARSLEVKRDADNHVEIVTSEDVGKMPDKNVADSLERVSGVTISSATAGEG